MNRAAPPIDRGMSRPRLLLCLGLLACALAASAGAAQAAVLPAGWPTHLLVGMRDEENGAADLHAQTPMEARYHYLAGGVNTGQGWANWAEGGGSFVSKFVADSQANGFLPIFSLYDIRPSLPGATQSDERTGDLQNLANVDTMRAYLADVKLFMQKASQAGGPVVLHVEPDLWGYAQVAAGDGGNASAVPAQVAATGMGELSGLPDTVAGLAQAFVRLRDTYAKNVELAYHLSIWGTGVDIAHADSSDAAVDELAAKSTAFYQSLGASFDLVFAETADRDSGYAQNVDGNTESWWDEADFARHARYLRDVSTTLDKKVVVWQVPLGNRVMAAMNNTPFHWQDNRVEWLLGPDAKAHLAPYVNAGVIGFLFGAAQANSTCACDAAKDGLTNPAPINGNTVASFNADDDGGYFKKQVAAYYKATPPTLPAVVRAASKAKARTKAPRLRIKGHVSARSVRRGASITVTVRVTSGSTAATLVAIQLYGPGKKKAFSAQQAFKDQKLRKRVPRRFTMRFKVPAGAARGRWTVKVGVFNPDWNRLYSWTDNAGTFTVR